MARRRDYRYEDTPPERGGNKEIKIILAAAVALFLELSLFHIFGKVGGWISYAEFGLFGLAAYVFPVLLFVLVAFLMFSKRRRGLKIACGVIFFICLCAFIHMVSFAGFEDYAVVKYFTDCAEGTAGGGIIGGLLALGLTKAVSLVGAYVVIILAALVCLLIVCEVPLIDAFRNTFKKPLRQEEDWDDEPDKVVRPRSRRQAEEEEEAYRRARSRAQQEAYEEDRRRASSRRMEEEDEPVYETTDDEGVVIRIVDSRKRRRKPRTALQRSSNKARPLRNGANIYSLRTQTKEKGLGNNLDIVPGRTNIDEIREITAPAVKAEEEQAIRKETTEARPQSAEMQAEQKKTVRRERKPSEKVTSETRIREEKEKKAPAKNFAEEPDSGAAVKGKKNGDDGYIYPPLSLLTPRKGKGRGANDAELARVSEKLELILSNFGVAAKVVNVQSGPSVTRYELQPEMGTRVSKITSLEDDLKLNLAVSDIRIEAPIPGRAAIGIEIPNATKETVLIREILEAPDLINHKSKIAFGAGINISGEVVVADIAKMPHLLVAGTTGSGKSVFMNSIIMSILYRAKPSEVGLIIIDPKKIEFGVYSGIPHLVKDVVTDPGQAVSTLRWAVNEMTNRYQRMQLSGVRDFKSYNEKFDKGTLSSEEENPKRMPQIVIVIDELADLMMVASKEAEALICRLAQLARAAGIHLIIATQRPSVDVVTGLIKANIPARVALLVASQVDSRTIIDMKGAEELLGNGDMLFYPTGFPKPVRLQGAFVSDDDVANVVDFLKKHKTEDYFAEEAQQIAEFMNNTTDGQMEIGGDSGQSNASKQDEYLFEAGKLCIEMGKASSSMLQRHFSVGFNRAAKIIDQLTEMGAISPPNGAKPREILVDLYTFEEMFQTKSE